MKVWVILSDCGLNGPWIHGVFASEPGEEVVRQCEKEASGTTGYQFTTVPTFEVVNPENRKGVATFTLSFDNVNGGWHGTVRREGTVSPMEMKYVSLKGCQREASGWLKGEGYELVGPWKDLGFGVWVRKGVRA